MNDEFAKRVRSAAIAGWWTLLAAAIWMTAGWLAYLVILNTQPQWMLTLWGGGQLTWSKVQEIGFVMFALFKVILFVALLIVIWLSIWQCKLKRSQ